MRETVAVYILLLIRKRQPKGGIIPNLYETSVNETVAKRHILRSNICL